MPSMVPLHSPTDHPLTSEVIVAGFGRNEEAASREDVVCRVFTCSGCSRLSHGSERNCRGQPSTKSGCSIHVASLQAQIHRRRHGVPYYALPYAITVGRGFGAAAIYLFGRRLRAAEAPRRGRRRRSSKLMPTSKPADRDLPKNGEDKDPVTRLHFRLDHRPRPDGGRIASEPEKSSGFPPCRNAERAEDARRALPKAEAVLVGDVETIAGAKDVASRPTRSAASMP